MNISHPRGFVFWPIPYTGGEELFAAFSRHYGLEGPEQDDGTRAISYQAKVPKGAENYYVVASIREPYDRMICAWESMKEESLAEPETPKRAIQDYLKENPDNFPGFIKFLCHSRARRACIVQQRSYLIHPVHYYVKYESRDSDLSCLPFVKDPMSYARHNVRLSKTPNADRKLLLYDRDSRDLVREYWGRDFEYLSYPTDLNLV